MNPTVVRRPFIMMSESENESIQDIRELADFLDTKYTLPFGWRIGWDGILGFIPGFGDFATNLMSFYIVYRAAVLGCPLSVIMRMGLNILIDNLLDMVPILGNFFDFVWKSNAMNLALVENYLSNPHRTTMASRIIVLSAVGLLFLMMAGLAVLTFILARWFWGLFQNAW